MNKKYQKYILIHPNIFDTLKRTSYSNNFLKSKEQALMNVLKNRRMTTSQKLFHLNKIIFQQLPSQQLSSAIDAGTQTTNVKPPTHTGTSTNNRNVTTQINDDVEMVDVEREQIFENIVEPPPKPTKSQKPARLVRSPRKIAMSTRQVDRPQKDEEYLFDAEKAQNEFIDAVEDVSKQTFNYKNYKVSGMSDYGRKEITLHDQTTGEVSNIAKPRVVRKYQKHLKATTKEPQKNSEKGATVIDPRNLFNGRIWVNYENIE